jgi:hypothetical protein
MGASTKTHAVIHGFPAYPFFQHGWLESLAQEQRDGPSELVIDLSALQLHTPATLVEHQGQLAERVQGEYQPKRLRFRQLAWVQQSGLYNRLAEVPSDHPCRILQGMLAWSPAGKEPIFLMAKQASDQAGLMFSSREFVEETRTGPVEQVDLIRRWSPPPPMLSGLVPNPPVIRRRYAGDPIRIKIGRRAFRQRLFIGSLQEQTDRRPEVDFVLNLGEEPSRWTASGGTVHPGDRWVAKGEGEAGMSLEEIELEANWVIERLQAGRSVLVHCVAGMNRSATIAIAILIIQEGLSAESAFGRLSVSHPWARPDPGHWLRLKWLAKRTGIQSD